jgi:hypothetical protein
MLARDKHSSLLRKSVTYGQKVSQHWAQVPKMEVELSSSSTCHNFPVFDIQLEEATTLILECLSVTYWKEKMVP